MTFVHSNTAELRRPDDDASDEAWVATQYDRIVRHLSAALDNDDLGPIVSDGAPSYDVAHALRQRFRRRIGVTARVGIDERDGAYNVAVMVAR